MSLFTQHDLRICTEVRGMLRIVKVVILVQFYRIVGKNKQTQKQTEIVKACLDFFFFFTSRNAEKKNPQHSGAQIECVMSKCMIQTQQETAQRLENESYSGSL